MAVCAGAYNDSIYSKKKGYSQFIQVPPEDYFDQAVAKKITQLPNSNLFNPVQTPHIVTAVDIPVSNGNPERLTATHNMYGGRYFFQCYAKIIAICRSKRLNNSECFIILFVVLLFWPSVFSSKMVYSPQ